MLGNNLTGVLTKYFSAADSKLSGPLGEALANALASGDKVYVYDPNRSGDPWVEFTAGGPGNPLSPESGNDADLDITITPTTAIFVDFQGSGTRQPARVSAFDSPQAASDVTVHGTDSTSGEGWNAFCLPMGATANGKFNNGVMQNMGTFDNPQTGDRIWVKKLTGGYERPIRYNGSQWMQGSRPATGITIAPGQSFWYYRNGTGTTTWHAGGITIE